MKTKSFLLLLPLALLLGFTKKGKLPQIKGTWVLETERHGKEEAKAVSQKTTKRKIITDTHFVWTEHDEAGNLVAMAGGTYLLEDGDIYTEQIEFAYPKGSMLLGASIPFDCQVRDGKWTHSGFLQYREMNPDTRAYEVVRTEKLTERWKKIK